MIKDKIITDIKEAISLLASPKTFFLFCVPLWLVGVVISATVATQLNMNDMARNNEQLINLGQPFLSCDNYPNKEACLWEQALNKKVVDSGIVKPLILANSKHEYGGSLLGVLKVMTYDPEMHKATESARINLTSKMLELSLEEQKASGTASVEKIESGKKALNYFEEMKASSGDEIDKVHDALKDLMEPTLIYIWTLLFILNLLIRHTSISYSVKYTARDKSNEGNEDS